jgi:hypothetical protein
VAGHFPVAGMQGYLNLKGYGEFDNANRPDGWNLWLTFVLFAGAANHPTSSSPPPILNQNPLVDEAIHCLRESAANIRLGLETDIHSVSGAQLKSSIFRCRDRHVRCAKSRHS